MNGVPSDQLRLLILHALPEDVSLHGSPPRLETLYLPAAHAKALRPDTMLVAGIRGAGKSFWWAALQDLRHREEIARHADIRERLVTSIGYGERPSPEDYPGPDTLSDLARAHDPRIVWRTVVFAHVASRLVPDGFTSLPGWGPKVMWVREHAEAGGRLGTNGAT